MTFAESPLRVLLVEDEDSFAEWVKARLSGAEVVRVASATEAAVAMARDRYDVVLLDLTLPDASGLRTVERVLMAPMVPAAIVVSNVRDEALRRECLKRGAQGYVDKGELACEADPSHHLRSEIDDAMARQHGTNERLLYLVSLLGRATTTDKG